MAEPIEEWVERVRRGEPRALARAITVVENRAPGWRELLRGLFPHSGGATLVGLTGAPGSGKSTLVDQLARQFRAEGQTVGIIAVDPTSPFSGGAILGDRIRMQRHHSDPGIYIRSMATRGALGGLAAATADVAMVLDASGRQVVMIETVGVGQDEVDVAHLADVTVVVLVPGMGDDVQSLKAGIMEIADVFVVNKSDREGAERIEREILALQSLAGATAGGRWGRRPPGTPAWTPPVIKTVASEGRGTTELAQAIADCRRYLDGCELGRLRRVENWRNRLLEMLRAELTERLRRDYLDPQRAARMAAEIADRRRDPYALVEEILDEVAPARRTSENQQ